ncbi:TonB-dependent receptor family protein [Dokdonia sp. MED134]|uniref:TonB-dependent receptor family protein n=1 Tax=Dokdonia sp. MED134 TaxID=313590 RepID=UPI000068BFCD|nr:TonB-dependent receptor [Dokdonia sp. MED134]
MKKTRIVTLINLLAFASICYSQTGAIPEQTIDTVIIQSTRIQSTLDRIPAAVSVIKTVPQDATRQQLSLQEYVQGVPGVFTQNVTNFAQDLRVSIRGFGARSSFGIRGIKLIVDGIPETTPDGQGQLDNLTLGIIDRIEVIKGPSSSLYGNASGGVIDIKTRSYDSENLGTEIKVGAGAFGFQNYQATAAIGDSLASYIFHANYIQSDGYRDQSGFEQINTNFKGRFALADSLYLTTILNYTDAPQADDPGGLTLEEVNTNRRQARDRNQLFKTGEAISQLKVGASLEWLINKKSSFTTYGFYSNRLFDGLLPFENGGIVDLNRNYMGQGAAYRYTKGHNTLQVGYDFAFQNDRRRRFQNLEGEQGDLSLSQKEKFTNLGVYLTDHFNIDKWLFTAGARFDYNKLSADDDFLSDGDDSGSVTLNSFNPSVGVSYAFAKAFIPFVNASTSFETPSLSEVSTSPDGLSGFNENLAPQKATSVEVGVKGALSNKLRYQVTTFSINTRDDLVPFELEAFPDREFYRNAGKTNRLGVEVEGQYAFSKNLQARASYTYSDFTYDEFTVGDADYAGNALPGIAKHMSTLGLLYDTEAGFSARVSANFIGSQFAQDSNDTAIDGYELVNVQLSYQTLFREIQIKPYLGINNALDQEYTDNVRINAFGNRFYEPAPGFTMYGGVILNF